MFQYLIDKEVPLTTEYLGKVLADFQTRLWPKFKKNLDYYEGKQDILKKQATDIGKPCNKIIVNYCDNIVKNYLGYITGIPISYENNNFDEILDILKWNDVVNEDNELLKDALIYGRSFEINYVDEEGNQRFKVLDTRECVPIYDNSLNQDLLYVIRFYREDLVDEQTENYIVEVYTPTEIIKYKSGPGFTSFIEVGRELHYYGQCPVTVFSLNDEEENIFNKIVSLQDAYNELLSGEVDDFDSFADAYMILKGAIADEEDLKAMKQNRVLMLDPDADASYLTKNISDTQISNMLENVNQQIHKIAASPDFSDEKFMAQSGIAMRYKLVGFENNASNIETHMRKALQRRIELISSIINLVDGESLWREVTIRFTRNLPTDLSDTVNIVNSLRGLVSDETLLGLLPFVDDVDKELEKIKKQKEEDMELYAMGNPTQEPVEDEEDTDE